jgi:putative oxidoreductase
MAKQIESKHTDTVALIGRLLIAVLFLMSGLSKLTQPGATIGYIAAVGLPLPTISYFGSMTVELVGSVLLIAGYRVRPVALGLAVFTLMTAVFFHRAFADQNQMIHFMKNIAIMGGLLQVAAFGAGRFSLDRRFRQAAAPTAEPSLATH